MVVEISCENPPKNHVFLRFQGVLD